MHSLRVHRIRLHNRSSRHWLWQRIFQSLWRCTWNSWHWSGSSGLVDLREHHVLERQVLSFWKNKRMRIRFDGTTEGLPLVLTCSSHEPHSGIASGGHYYDWWHSWHGHVLILLLPLDTICRRRIWCDLIGSYRIFGTRRIRQPWWSQGRGSSSVSACRRACNTCAPFWPRLASSWCWSFWKVSL